MITTKRPNTDDYTQIGFIEAQDNQGNYQNIDHIYDSEGNIVFQQGYLNEYDGADDFRIPAIGKPLIDYAIYGNAFQDGVPTSGNPIMPEGTGERSAQLIPYPFYSSDGEYAGVQFMTDNGRIIANGTLTSGLLYYLWRPAKFPAGTYTMSVKGKHSGATIYFRDVTNSVSVAAIYGAQEGDRSVTFTVSEEISAMVYINAGSGSIDFDCTIMLNVGEKALSFEPTNGYKISISSGGNNLFSGEFSQFDNVGGTGNIYTYFYIPEDFTLTLIAKDTHTIPDNIFLGITKDGGQSTGGFTWAIPQRKNVTEGDIFTVKSSTSGYHYVSMYRKVASVLSWIMEHYYVMLNRGSTVLPYEPYVQPTLSNIYLGEVETTRSIGKIDLGTLNWSKGSSGNFTANTVISNCRIISNTQAGNAICTHLSEVSGNEVANTPYSFCSCLNNQARPFINKTGFENLTAEEFKETMSGVYMWYVLATPTTGIVNEPLMRIGDYADSVDFSQAGVEIPTLKRPNTTVIDITTSLPPSEVYAKYRGSKTQKYDLFLAANGDSFEAKNGQSLYIGDDT